MTTLHNMWHTYNNQKHATDAGTKMHLMLQSVFITSDSDATGDAALISKIRQVPGLSKLFSPQSKTEVPIAGTINNHFISRRIDRLLIDEANKTIHILDYKTDITPNDFRNKYITQINEYATLVRNIYPDYHIHAYILWTHNFSLEKLSIKPL